MGKPRCGHTASGADIPPRGVGAIGSAVSLTTGYARWFRLTNSSKALSNFSVNCA
ncbi:hypothetical protein A2U01_0117234, partial [Trifolium medium]|nr:hypothetical protein [Trifolium medium]